MLKLTLYCGYFTDPGVYLAILFPVTGECHRNARERLHLLLCITACMKSTLIWIY